MFSFGSIVEHEANFLILERLVSQNCFHSLVLLCNVVFVYSPSQRVIEWQCLNATD